MQITQTQGPDGPRIAVVEEEGVRPWERNAELLIVGQPHPRLEARLKVTGSARYASDVRLPGQLYARVLRSPHPHARIRRIDTSRAEGAPGVHAVLTQANAPDISWYEEGKLFALVRRACTRAAISRASRPSTSGATPRPGCTRPTSSSRRSMRLRARS